MQTTASKLKTVEDFAKGVNNHHHQPIALQIGEAIDKALDLVRGFKKSTPFSVEALNIIRKKIVALADSSDVVYNNVTMSGGDKDVTKHSLEYIDNEIKELKKQY